MSLPSLYTCILTYRKVYELSKIKLIDQFHRHFLDGISPYPNVKFLDSSKLNPFPNDSF